MDNKKIDPDDDFESTGIFSIKKSIKFNHVRYKRLY